MKYIFKKDVSRISSYLEKDKKLIFHGIKKANIQLFPVSLYILIDLIHQLDPWTIPNDN